MLRTTVAAVAGASLVAIAGAACAGDASSEAAGGGGVPAAKEISARDFSPNRFDRSSSMVVDNAWFPLTPGTQFVFAGSAREEGRRIPRRAVFTVTDLTKTIAGVRSIVVWDRDWAAGELVEAEMAYFAQDRDGNVWHLGEYPEEYEEGKFVDAPTWFHGLKGAKAGIAMRAAPGLRQAPYAQGFAPPPVHWVDHAAVHRMGVKTCVPAACYRRVLVTREFEPDKPQAAQLKYYARGIGIVRVGWLGKNDPDREVLLLTALRHLSPAAIAEARSEVRKLGRHGYLVSKDVYARTAPLQRFR